MAGLRGIQRFFSLVSPPGHEITNVAASFGALVNRGNFTALTVKCESYYAPNQ